MENLSLNFSLTNDKKDLWEQCKEQALINNQSQLLDKFDSVMGLALIANMYLLYYVWKSRKNYDSTKEFFKDNLIDFSFIIGITITYTLLRMSFKRWLL